MKFFFPDSHDYVDPDFDFQNDCEGSDRERHRTDQYAHEILDAPPYDGLLVSKSIVDGAGNKSGKYTVAQRHRLHRIGVHRFFRVNDWQTADGAPFPIMGDCGAFSYIDEPEPPLTVAEAIEFYESCGFTQGQSIDHIVPQYRPEWDEPGLCEVGPPLGVRERFNITLALAEEFLGEHKRRRCTFEPIGVAQGWSPTSYVEAVQRLAGMGYSYIALGGLVPLKTDQFMAVLRAVMANVPPDVRIHVLGVVRWEHLQEVVDLGVESVDSTSPLRQAFLDSKSNYYVGEAGNDAYAAVRVPQIDGNARLKRRLLAGELDYDSVRTLERRCLAGIRAYDADPTSIDLEDLLDDLDKYAKLLSPSGKWRLKNARVLRDRPWRRCECRLCREIGVEIVLFRGANRNRRRGFHNLHVAYQRVQRATGQARAEGKTRQLEVTP